MAPPPVQVSGLTKVYRTGWRRREVRALDGLTLELAPGEVFGLLGPNGSGKTTTLKLLTGLLRPTAGEARLFGLPAGDPKALARLGFMPEESYLPRFLNAHELLDFYGSLFSLPRALRRERIEALIDRVGIRRAARRPLKEYSKGMTRRVALAQALLNDPELVILDEPTSGLDPVGAREVKDLILDLKKRGKTVLVSSHLLADMESVCDRVGILAEGKLRVIGPVSELLVQKEVSSLELSGVPEEILRAMEELARKSGGAVVARSHRRQKLEELFLQIVQPPSGPSPR